MLPVTPDSERRAAVFERELWRIAVENFPAFMVIDDKGNDFYDGLE